MGEKKKNKVLIDSFAAIRLSISGLAPQEEKVGQKCDLRFRTVEGQEKYVFCFQGSIYFCQKRTFGKVKGEVPRRRRRKGRTR